MRRALFPFCKDILRMDSKKFTKNIVRTCQTLNMDISYFMTGEISNTNRLSSLNHQERIALNQIAEAFLSVCENKEES